MKNSIRYTTFILLSYSSLHNFALADSSGLTPEEAMKASWPTVCSTANVTGGLLGPELLSICQNNDLQSGGVASDSSTATSAVLGNAAQLADKHQKDKVDQRLEELKVKSAGGTASILTGERLGFFVTGQTTQSDRISTSHETGYNSDDGGFSIGIDYFFTNKWVAGFSVGYSNNDLILNEGTGSTELNSVSTLFYTNYAVTDAFSLDGYLGWTGIDYNMARNINFKIDCGCTPDFHGEATAKTHANKVATGLAAAYQMNFQSLSVYPSLKLDYSGTFVDAYSEQENSANISGVALNYQNQKIHSLKSELGLNLDYAFSTKWGVILPRVGLSYVHEFLNDSRTIHTSFVQDLNAPPYDMAFSTDNPDRDYMVFSTGISTVLPHGVQLFLNYERVDLHKYIDSYSVSGGLRVGF